MAHDSPTLEGYLQIGEASTRAEVTQRTLRYYEEKGLLKPPTRMEGGFRLYSPEDMERIERIKELRDLLGFSLADIKEMVEAEDVRMQLRAEWRKDADLADKTAKMHKARELTIQQIALIDDKMTKMAEMRSQLSERLVRYDNWLANNAAQELAAKGQSAASD